DNRLSGRSATKTHSMHRTVGKSYVCLLCLLAAFFVLFLASNFDAGAQRRQNRRRTPAQRQPPKPRVDYAKFTHHTHVEQKKLACDSCHKFPSKNWKAVRKGDDAFAD